MHMQMYTWNEVVMLIERITYFFFVGDISCSKLYFLFDDFFFDDCRYLWKCSLV